MTKPNYILQAALAVALGLGSSMSGIGSQAILTDDTTANQELPIAFQHKLQRLSVVASERGVRKTAYLKFDLSNMPKGVGGEQIMVGLKWPEHG